ncbi:hypothetical protein C8R44DRAFT_879548 [Mycena epipterygia]|nr:hypothetical protein C8R44DRAFT_879548 [Mycena epipterygia]
MAPTSTADIFADLLPRAIRLRPALQACMTVQTPANAHHRIRRSSSSRSIHCRGAIVIHAGASHCVRVCVRIRLIDILRPNARRSTVHDQRRRRYVRNLAPPAPAPRIERRARARRPARVSPDVIPFAGVFTAAWTRNFRAQHQSEVEGRKSRARSVKLDEDVDWADPPAGLA